MTLPHWWDEARSVRDGLRVYAVLNCADPGTTSTDNTEGCRSGGGRSAV